MDVGETQQSPFLHFLLASHGGDRQRSNQHA
jgi:hypothetical protein